MFTPKVLAFAACMLFTGSLNTIVTKLQDNVVVAHDAEGQPLRFKHPAFQTGVMFAGEALCLLPWALRRLYKRATRGSVLSADEAAMQRKQLRRSLLAFLLPACCDAVATCLLSLGLFYTHASVYQMLRGTLVIFAGFLTMLLLHRRLHSHHWVGIVLITAGAALVGASSLIYDRPSARLALGVSDTTLGGAAGSLFLRRALLLLDGLLGAGGGTAGDTAPNPLLGNVLVVLAQFIMEERFLVQYRAPVLLAVGVEGAWGVSICALALPLLTMVRGPDGQPIDSLTQALAEVRASHTLQWTTAATVASIAAFNLSGISVTKQLSGGSRATIDACRTLFIWLFALRMGWERFHMLQVVGFLVLLCGTSVFNEILRACLPQPPQRRRSGRRAHGGNGVGLAEPLLSGGGGPNHETQQVERDGAAGGVRFVDGPASQPIAAVRQGRADGHTRYTMARSVTILPMALSPHSLASLPSATFGGASFTYSVPHDLSIGGGLDGGAARAEEGLSGHLFTDSESDTDAGCSTTSRDASQHGPRPHTPWTAHRSDSGSADQPSIGP